MVALTINGTDAYSAWGVSMDDTSLAALMTPAPTKDRITSTSRTEHGTRVVTDAPVYLAERDITLQLNLTAKTESEFFARYAAFCEELQKPELVISTISGTYHCVYISCQQFSQFLRGIGKFVLRLKEYNPANR